MLTLLSPAKKLAEKTPEVSLENNPLLFKKETMTLVKTLKDYSAKDLAKLMDLSEKLSTLNQKRYQDFSLSQKNTLTALFMFQGDVYQTLKADTFNDKTLRFTNNHLRILSGLYGLLLPLNAIYPYRLEMGTGLKTDKGNNLYDYWGSKIANNLNETLENHKNPLIINLASQEYAKAICKKTLAYPIIDINFKENKNGQLKTIGILAKRARGAMANFMMSEQIDTLDKIYDFNQLGYHYDKNLSNEKQITFVNPG